MDSRDTDSRLKPEAVEMARYPKATRLAGIPPLALLTALASAQQA